MSAWQFDGVDDFGYFSTLATALQNVPTAAHTIAWLGRRNETGVETGITSLATAGGTARLVIEMSPTNTLYFDCNGSTSGLTAPTDTNTVIYVATRTAGAAQTPHAYIRDLTTGVTDVDADWPGTSSDGTALASTDRVYVGCLTDTLAFGAEWCGLLGYWDVALSGAQVAELWANKRTSDWWTNSGGQPQFLAELTSASPVDLTGNSSFVSFNGTVDAGETLENWNFDGTGNNAGGSFIRIGRGYGRPPLRERAWY
jgi:hypothetical protein